MNPAQTSNKTTTINVTIINPLQREMKTATRFERQKGMERANLNVITGIMTNQGPAIAVAIVIH